MNDRFKFRAWFEGRFIYKSLCDSNVYTEDDKCICLANNLPDLHWEQCTGLKDKNGKLIYEGDIVKSGKHIYPVEWCINGFAVNDGCDYLVDNEEWEVIGNIHENKELLDEQ